MPLGTEVNVGPGDVVLDGVAALTLVSQRNVMKLVRKVVSQVTDQLDLQAIMNTVKTWSDEWLLRLNIDKCETVSYYLKHPPLDTQYHIIDGNTTHILEQETQLSLRDRATRACQLKSGKVLHKCRRLVFEKV